MSDGPDSGSPLQARKGLLIFGGPILVAGALFLTNCDRGRAPETRDTQLLSFGYLSGKQLPDSLALLPPPPTDASADMKADEEARLAALSSAGSARKAQAARDSVLAFPEAAQNFACALGADIDKNRTPHLYSMMSKILIDVRAASYPAKNHYKRVRPFVAHQTASCAPEYAAMLRGDGSYPSAQGATGWAYALILSELRPDRLDALMIRARQFGQSRLICDVQWESDINAGQAIGQAVVAQVREDAQFQADLAAAKKEVAAVLKAGLAPTNCAAETAALKDVKPAARS